MSSNILCPPVSLAADAYCLLDIYLTLSKDAKGYGLPEDLRTITSTQPSKSREEKKPKDKSNKAKRREVCLPACSFLIRENILIRPNLICTHDVKVRCLIVRLGKKQTSLILWRMSASK